MRPRPALAIARAAACPLTKAPVRLTSITFCQAARVYSRNGARLTTPALLTWMSSRPSLR